MSIPTVHTWDLVAVQQRERAAEFSSSALTIRLARDRRRARAAGRYAAAAHLSTRVAVWLNARAVRRSDLTRRAVC